MPQSLIIFSQNIVHEHIMFYVIMVIMATTQDSVDWEWFKYDNMRRFH